MKTLKDGQKAQIEFKTQDKGKIQLICDVENYEDDILFLNFPESFMQYSKYLEEGTEVKAYVFTGPNIKVLDSIVLTEPTDNILEIEFPQDYETIQRRAYIRENLAYNITIQSDKQTIQAKTIDIGGGGFRFKSNEIIEQDSYSTVLIDLNDGSPLIKCQGKVSHKNHFAEDEYLVEFIEISEKDRSKIIQQCIVHQRQKVKEEKEQKLNTEDDKAK